MAYSIEFTPRAEKDLGALDRRVQIRIQRRIDSLANAPRPAGSTKLKGSEDLFRIRVGDHRVIYQIQDEVLLVLIVRIGDRREIYRIIERL